MTAIFDLTGKTALVTGANTGLGEGICKALAEAGATVYGTGRREGGYVSILADLLDKDAPLSIMNALLAKAGRIDILVNNAGTIRRADVLEFSDKDWDEVLQVNLTALFKLSQLAARQFAAQGTGGKIINIASMLSFQGGIRVASYTAAKSAVRGLTLEMANELAPKGINVNAIAPGYMVTNNTEALRSDPERSESILARIPAGRWGRPSDLSGAAVFLASAASDYVHGVTLPVDGGWLGR
ncbi:MAG: 2-dehydro-3-deoxy-D-gluconate 5-dehydrogenase KduD [Oscillospiraceae bacterium]|jgi:2-deoxy-D-gluconate 3-dehydrogenase|nr:2-dehydro-3-deoxy-D-gluconate 5-dehydrogenase KduD [Oscillospiraceae bacterium]